MLYTGKGDDGTTKDFVSKPGERKSKASCQTEALGALDEFNSFLGLVKVKSAGIDWQVGGKTPPEIIHWLQNCLFIVQAEVAGADKHLDAGKVAELEKYTDEIEEMLPPIKTFFISGGTELAALFDIARTLARKAERRVVAGSVRDEFKAMNETLAFLNRLSSLLYALARLTNHKGGIKEEPPRY
ncbi:cob(I)yrinic acid a,c-diamide adenosyltransferase [Patescibacteria group bacterium]|nr:cob(I)yrinic acid a,c-diamide adenosyltransferase [Patescibacteria group bacterium]MDE1946905.1 cob(I)yrinic acid a,c-diamide adenosyltransferase [Patescibacteria group bacterium]MDE2011106.1 cob(I)yrinic acid a,c-diamide adenosyltransferase [Patescibacteria group bacterium]MDE2233202.1 cob(I)yrinic acid a,c-diamide adenosyltransferase [Patescibacteria group bacterium]